MERREFKRLPAETEVRIRPVPAGERQVHTASGKNISGGGILLSSDRMFEEGTLLDIEVLTTTHRSFTRAFRPLRARVRVLRAEGEAPPYDLAAVFVEVEP